MSTPIDEEIHDRLHAFVDGELEPAEAEAFRDHLGECMRCQEELEEVIQLQSLGEQLARQQASPPLRNTSRPERAPRARAFRTVWAHRTWLASAVGVSLAAALLLVLPRLSGPEAWGPEALALGPTRSLEGRLSWQGTSTYRPYAVNRSGNERPTDPVPLKVLVKLEEEGDFQGVAAAHLLRGEREQAAEALKRAPSTPDADSDRALALLSKGDLEAALILLEDVLERDPNHSAALWNHGLVLRELDLDVLAAQVFTRVAERNEPGWSAEARERAALLKGRTEEHIHRWDAAWDANKALLQKGTPLPEGTLREAPSLTRKYLYLSAWSAPSEQRVRALLPLARELDAHYGARVLEPYIERIARRDFRRRGPLAATFSEVLAGRLAPGAADAFLRELQAAGEEDILLGALTLLGRLPAQVDEFVRAARELGDPWFLMRAQLERAQAQFAESRLGEAEATLLTALPECERQGLDARCGELELHLAHLYTVQHRLVEAQEHALHGWRRARASSDLESEVQFLQLLSNISRFRDSFALARAYLNESASRRPASCSAQIFLHESQAQLLLSELRFDKARAELERVPECGLPRSMLSSTAWATLARVDPRPGDVDKVHAQAEQLRAQPKNRPGFLLQVDRTVASAELVRDRARGREKLREIIAAADRLPREDTGARKARADSYAELRLDSGKAQAYAEALGLFAEELGIPAPARCALGVEVAEERTLVVARGASGEILGSFDASRRTLDFAMEKLVGGPVLAALRACERVDVYARHPIHGRAGVLPPEMAWSYVNGPERSAPGPAGMPRQLIVGDVQAPASLGLPRLSPWTPERSVPGSRVDLTGAAATPTRVMEEMTHADEVDIHAHGLVNLGLSDASLIVLSPEPNGHYALTAGDVRRHHLQRAPVVVLGSCRAAQSAPYLHEPWSLPVAFLEAGARAVIASPVDIPDREAGPFFEAVRTRIRQGASPAIAVRDERMRLLATTPDSWVQTVVVFE